MLNKTAYELYSKFYFYYLKYCCYINAEIKRIPKGNNS